MRKNDRNSFFDEVEAELRRDRFVSSFASYTLGLIILGIIASIAVFAWLVVTSQ